MTPTGIQFGDRSGDAIGVFDSGVGGLSVLRALHAELPGERFVYVADSGHAPYGERDDTHVLTRSYSITRYLLEHAPLTEASYSIEAAMPSALEAKSLGIARREPCLVMTRSTALCGVTGDAQ